MVQSVCFSPTGTTKKVVAAVAEEMAQVLGAGQVLHDITLPDKRVTPLEFSAGDIVIIGVPVYAGRVPGFLVPYLATLAGNGAIGVPVVVYGNRDYDDALIELRDLMEQAGVHTVAAGAFIGEHSYSRIVAADRPDAEDLAAAREFGRQAAEKVVRGAVSAGPIAVKGQYPYRCMMPKPKPGAPVPSPVYPKVTDDCTDCGLCVGVCPGSCILPENVRSHTGECIKCCACVKICPVGARYFDDPSYLKIKSFLEKSFVRRAEPETFI
jgi:NAD-dependent dihydropyrimidine dehydrogenase PreA subunit/flavodoxin